MSSDDSCLLSLLLLVFFLASGFVMFLKQTLKADLNFLLLDDFRSIAFDVYKFAVLNVLLEFH